MDMYDRLISFLSVLFVVILFYVIYSAKSKAATVAQQVSEGAEKTVDTLLNQPVVDNPINRAAIHIVTKGKNEYDIDYPESNSFMGAVGRQLNKWLNFHDDAFLDAIDEIPQDAKEALDKFIKDSADE